MAKNIKLRDVFEDFASVYTTQFVEMMIEGCSGGLYKDEIFNNDGEFELPDVRKFVRFQHGDNDYHYQFSNPEDDILQENPKILCEYFLKHLKQETYYSKEYPDLFKNVKDCLVKFSS